MNPLLRDLESSMEQVVIWEAANYYRKDNTLELLNDEFILKDKQCRELTIHCLNSINQSIDELTILYCQMLGQKEILGGFP